MKRYCIIIFCCFWSVVTARASGILGIQNNTDQFVYVSFNSRGAPMWFTVPGTQFNLRCKQMFIGAIDRVSNVTYYYGPEHEKHHIDIATIPRETSALVVVHHNGSYTLNAIPK